MGKEAMCRVWANGQEVSSKVLLETDDVIFRGSLRVSVPLKSLNSVRVAGDRLVIASEAGEYAIELGEKQATSWAKTILHPPTLIDKLGIKNKKSIAALGFTDILFLESLPHETSLVSGKQYDAILVRFDCSQELRSIQSLKHSLAADGSIWVVFPRGNKEIPENHVITSCRLAGLMDNKVCRFSATETALRFARKKPQAS